MKGRIIGGGLPKFVAIPDDDIVGRNLYFSNSANGLNWINSGIQADGNNVPSVRQGGNGKEITKVNGVYYMLTRNGSIVTTSNFRQYNQITINSIDFNNGYKYFAGQYKFLWYSEIYSCFVAHARKENITSTDNELSTWISTDNCQNWVRIHTIFTGQIRNFLCLAVDKQTDEFLLCTDVANNPNAVFAGRPFAGGVFTETRNNQNNLVYLNPTDAIVQNGLFVYIQGMVGSSSSFCTTVDVTSADNFRNTTSPAGQLVDPSTGSFVSIATCPHAPVNSRFVACAYDNNLDIRYSLNSANAWQVATLPNITIPSGGTIQTKLIGLRKQSGYLLSWNTRDSINNNVASGILHSPDGVTWFNADIADAINFRGFMDIYET